MDNISWNPGGQVGVVQPDPSKAMVVFFTAPKHIPSKSEASGRSEYENRDYVRVQQPGERDAVTKEVTPGDQQRWPEQWKAYKAGQQPQPDGILVDVLFPTNPAIILNLKAWGILTIEQLAEMADTASGNLPFGGDLKARAVKYLKTVKGAEGFNKLEAELDRERAKSASLAAEMADLKATVHQMAHDQAAIANGSGGSGGMTPEMVAQMISAAVAAAVPAKRGPGRPPKEEN